MKVGSLVICPNGTGMISPAFERIGCHMLPASNDIVYTVRDVFASEFDGGCLLIRVEEVVNPIHPIHGEECSYGVEIFREIQPPLDLTELLEETLLETV
jgi:hypothetical protein